MDSDRVFWDRLADMPPWEAEQECISRREQLCLQMAMLDNERENIARPLTGQREREYKKIGVAKTEIAAQLTKINERVKYLRKLQTMLQWKEAVRVLFGQDAFDECVIFIEQRYQHLEDTRHEWA